MSVSSSSPPAGLDDFVTVLPGAQETRSRRGILRYYGTTDFSDGLWAGVELVGEAGRNDGTVKGRRYFTCVPGQGIFVRPQYVVPYTTTERTTTLSHDTSYATLEQRCQQTHDALAATEQLAQRQAQQLREAHEVELDLRVQLATMVQELERTKVATTSAVEQQSNVAHRAVSTFSVAVQTETANDEQASQQQPQVSDAEHAKDAEEQRQLRELCDLLEDELRQERIQSDELTRLLKAVTEEKAALETRLAQAQDTQTQAQQTLQDSLDDARRKLFALEAEHNVHTQLQTHCDELYKQIDALQAAQADELQRLKASHAHELDMERRAKEDAVQRMTVLQAELDTVGERLVHAGAAVTTLCDPISAIERAQYESTIAELQQTVLALYTNDDEEDIKALRVWPACATLHTIGNGAVDGQVALQELNAWSQGPAQEAAQLTAEMRAGVFRVLDFSSGEACQRSTRQMFGISS